MRTLTLLLFVALVATTYAVKVKELADILMFALSDSTGAQCATTALNLRAQPSTNGGYIRTIPKGASVNVHSVNNGWAQVDGGYVSAEYLTDCGAVTKCTTTALNLRSSPSTSAGVIRTLPGGAQVKVYSTSNGWAQVDGGYVSAEYLTNCGSSGPVTKCATTALNLRSQPSTNGGFIKTIPAGGQVRVHSTNNGWAQVDGGYVSAQYLSDCGGGSGGGSNCGQAYDNGRAVGEKRCVNIDGSKVVTSTADAFNRMKSAAASNGVHLRINSGFRTMAEQEYFYNCYVTKRCNNGNLAARPGYSNHQNGIALDINSPSDVYNWLSRHASSYGFIRTVPSEVWHWEYRPGSRCNSWVSYSCN